MIKEAKVIRTFGYCDTFGLVRCALEVMPDHIHLFVGAKPTHTPLRREVN